MCVQLTAFKDAEYKVTFLDAVILEDGYRTLYAALQYGNHLR